MRIELVGGLGVGKSTLCDALERIGFNAIYEVLNTNPFLSDCFRDPENFRFPSQMYFALSKFHEIKKFERNDRINVLDQSILNVRAYTNMLFRDQDPEALELLNGTFDYFESRLGKSDLLINLQCSPMEQLKRIRGRNRGHEQSVQLDYITDLQHEINLLLDKARAEGEAVLDIDTELVFFPDNLDYAEALARQIGDMFSRDLVSMIDRKVPAQLGLPGDFQL